MLLLLSRFLALVCVALGAQSFTNFDLKGARKKTLVAVQCGFALAI